MTFQLTDAEAHRIEYLAARYGVDADTFGHETLDRALAEREVFLQGVEEGLDDIRNGRFAEHAQVVEEMERLLSE